jgi:branched-chain amino acid transport system substrate-binding protein
MFRSNNESENKQILIGHISPLTGDEAIYGNWEKEGIELALSEIPDDSKVKIKVIHEDDKADPKTAVSAIEKMISNDNCQYIIGASLSSTTLACAPVANKNKVVLITPSAQSPKISDAGDYVFRLFVSSKIEGKYLSDLCDLFSLKKIAIIYLNNDYGMGLKNVLISELQNKQTIITSVESFGDGEKDFKTHITKLKIGQPDGIFILAYPNDIINILPQIKSFKFSARLFAPDAFEADEIIKTVGASAEGVTYVYPVLPSKDFSEKVSSAFKRKYGKNINIYNAVGYDALKIAYHVIEKLSDEGKAITGENIKNELYKIRNFNGASGVISFDKNGDVVERPMEVRTVKDGKFIKL